MNYEQFIRLYECEILSYSKYDKNTEEVVHRYDVLVTDRITKVCDHYYSNIYSWGGAEPKKGVFNSIPRIGDNINMYISKHQTFRKNTVSSDELTKTV